MQSQPRFWPMTVAVLSLALLAILIPVVAMMIAFASAFTTWGSAVTPEDAADAFHAVLVGAISGGLAVVGGLVALFAGRGVAVRIVSACALIIGLFTGGIHALLAASYVRSVTPPVAQPEGPTCGPGSHPAVFGPESTYTACPKDLATAASFLDTAIPQLPTTDVTVASVEDAASQISPDSYIGTYDAGDSIVVTWIAAPVSCAYATFDGSTWNAGTSGMLADGGCAVVTLDTSG